MKKTRANLSNTAIAYYRISTDDEKQRLGLDVQKQAVHSWAKRNGIEIIAEFSEEVSGGAALENRAGLLDALSSVAAHKCKYLICQKIDRFSRDFLTAALAEKELQNHGASLVLADGNGSGGDPTAELVKGVLLSVAKFERAMIKARTKAALQLKKSRSERTGTVPYGFQLSADGIHLEENQTEQKIIQLMKQLRGEGKKLREIQEEIKSQGFSNRKGNSFNLPFIHQMTNS